MELDITCGLKLKYGYIIIPDKDQYTLYKRVKSKERATGELRYDDEGKQIYTWNRVGYYGKVIHALERYRAELIRSQLMKCIVELDGYIKIIEKADKTFKEMLDRYGVKDV